MSIYKKRNFTLKITQFLVKLGPKLAKNGGFFSQFLAAAFLARNVSQTHFSFSREMREMCISNSHKTLDWNSLIKDTLEANQSFKSLKIFHGLYRDMKTESVLTFSPGVMEALKLTKDLPSLYLTNVTLSQDFLNEICKLKSLRKLNIGTSITPEFVKQLAFSKNPIEHFKAKITGNEKSISNAIKVLYIEKKNTMKTVGTYDLREEDEFDSIDHENCEALPNFNMCPNITHISGPLHMHDLELISDLPKLERLSINAEININYLKAFHKMNFSNLKYLYLLNLKSGNECNEFLEELANVQFPCLKRLYVTFDKFGTENFLENAAELIPLTEKTLENLITKIPSMISLVVNVNIGIDFTDEITHQFMLKMLIYENFLIAIEVNDANDRYKKRVERFFKEKGTAIYNKWKSMRDECDEMNSRFMYGRFVDQN